MKKILFFILIFFITNNVNALEKIVFIDLNYIFINSNAGKDLKLQIENKKKKLNEEIAIFQKNIDDEKKILISQKNVISQEEYKKKLNNLENEIKNINIKISKKNKELNLFKSKVENEFFNKLNSIIENYSTNNSISLILKRENLLMAKKNLDITKDIFDLFNEKINKITIN